MMNWLKMLAVVFLGIMFGICATIILEVKSIWISIIICQAFYSSFFVLFDVYKEEKEEK